MSDTSDNRAPFPQTGKPTGGTAGQVGRGHGPAAEQATAQSGGIGQQAGAAAGDLRDVASGLADTARDVASGAGERLRSTVEEQKAAGADWISGIADAIRRVGEELEGQIPQGAQYARRAAAEIENVSEALRRRDIGDLVGGVQDFARRQPTAFLGATVLAGFALTRFLKTSAGRRTGTGARSEATFSGTSGRGGSAGQDRTPAGPVGLSGSRRGVATSGIEPGAGSARPQSGVAGSQFASGDPGGVSPEAPGFTPNPAGPGPNRP